MPIETKKKKNSNCASSTEKRITRSQVKNNSEKKEDPVKKGGNAVECQNDNFKSPQVKNSKEKNEDLSKKKINPVEYQDGSLPSSICPVVKLPVIKKLLGDPTFRFSFVKSSIGNPVATNIDRAQGFGSASVVSKCHKEVIINQLKRFQLFKVLSSFDRRTTAITWHPKYPQVFAAGSKGGDILLHNLNGADDYFTHGVGAGGSILGLMCDENEPYTVYTASLTGKICRKNFLKKTTKVLYSLPYCWDNWFTSITQCRNRKCILSGDSKGNAYLLSTSGEPIWKQRENIHSSKVTHCEFNIHNPDIFVTSSTDHTVKLWDLRTIPSSEKKAKPLATFHHVKAVNSAYFSPSNGINMLTTDQHSELRVYSGPLWDEVIKITHPHRQFQHMTQMKASWHPLEDIIMVGRYPDNDVQTNDSRTIDFYDGLDGKLLYQIPSPNKNIISLNAMNSTGEVLASAAGFNIMLLKDGEVLNGDRFESESENSRNSVLNLTKNKRKRSQQDEQRCKKDVSSKEKKFKS